MLGKTLPERVHELRLGLPAMKTTSLILMTRFLRRLPELGTELRDVTESERNYQSNLKSTIIAFCAFLATTFVILK
jgi:hypothetical protein